MAEKKPVRGTSPTLLIQVMLRTRRGGLGSDLWLVIDHEDILDDLQAFQMFHERDVSRVRQIGVPRALVSKCQHVHVGEAEVLSFRAVVDAVLKGEDAGDPVLQAAKGVGDLPDLVFCGGSFVFENDDVSCHDRRLPRRCCEDTTGRMPGQANNELWLVS